jgi:hypothetical protein
VQRLVLVVILAVILIGLPLLVLSDADISASDAAISHNEATGNISKVGNSSASATITITMYTGDEE